MSDSVSEVGSEFALRPSEGGDLTRAVRKLVGPRTNLLVGSGREALRLLLYDAAARGRTVVAFPAFICPALLTALHPSQTARFLPTTSELAPTAESIRGLLRTVYPDDLAIVAAPYFGAAYPAETRDALKSAWAAGIEVIEDRSHSMFSHEAQLDTPRGFASLRKWGALPDGGVAYGTAVDELATSEPAGGASYELRRDGMRAKARFLDEGEGDKEAYLDQLARGEQALDEVSGVRPITDESLAILSSWNLGTLRSARQSNARRLMQGLRKIDGVEPLVRFGPDDTPLGVPVLCDDRDRIRKGLIAQQIYCPIHWVLPEAVGADIFVHEHDIQNRILTLVCDQRYDKVDMKRTLEVLGRLAR